MEGGGGGRGAGEEKQGSQEERGGWLVGGYHGNSQERWCSGPEAWELGWLRNGQKGLGSGCFRKSRWDWGRALVVGRRGRGPRDTWELG